MNNRLLIKLLFLLITITTIAPAHAQDTASDVPLAVLVQLRSEHNRIEAVKKAHDTKKLKQLMNDALGVRDAMILDFKDHFTRCPVYYFMDTNADLVQKKVFAGTLTNADGSPATHLPIDANSTNYLVVYYGYLAPVYKSNRTPEDSLRAAINVEPPMGRGLVIQDDEFREITYIYKSDYEDVFFNRKKDYGNYQFRSKTFDMEYYPFVKLFNIRLTQPYSVADFYINRRLYKKELDDNDR